MVDESEPNEVELGSGGGDGTADRGSLFVVGVGASAGGLEALTALVKNLAIDSMAFVVVQHLSPHHESMLPELLGRESPLSVVEIKNGMRVEANHVYVAPPNASVAILQGVLQLLAPESRLPIDAFFRSLAEDLGPNAIGVVLSGMGTDGTFGLKEIKARGGLAFCQDPQTAKFDAMPRSALDSGVVDRCLSPEALGGELAAVSAHPYLARSKAALSADERAEMGRLFALLRKKYGHDLSLYKPSTISRRIERRMALHKIERFADYVRFAQEQSEELATLYKELLINVTSFFRDAEPFEALKTTVLPRILEHKKPGDTIRAWIPACASGEEAYSIAMLWLEVLEESAREYKLQLFGTDVDGASIEQARRGIYPPNIELDVSPARLQRFFTLVGRDYQVSRRVRDTLVFSTQNLTKDPPFSRLDLVSCRNVLIYLQPLLQKRVLRILHYALAPDGYLMLGNSETVGDCADLFSMIDRKNKLYAKKNLPSAGLFELRAGFSVAGDTSPTPAAVERHGGAQTAQQLANRRILERYGPPSVLVNENLDVLQFRGDMGPYMAPAAGTATLQLLKLLRPELHVEVWRAAQHALRESTMVRAAGLQLPGPRAGDAPRAVSLTLIPIHEPETKSRCLLLVFEEEGASAPVPALPSEGPEDEPANSADARIRELEHEVASAKEYLQTLIEELETSNEELKSTNEELQSSNEELQSTNEELETSKEELQATNEELTTLNNELQHRMGALARSNSDLDNVLHHVGEPIVFVTSDLRVRKVSESAIVALGIGEADTGRSLAQLAPLFGGIDVERIVLRVLERFVPAIAQFRAHDGQWFELHVAPYRAASNVVDGAVMVVRIDPEKRDRELVIDIDAYAERALAAVPHPLAILDPQLRVLWVNGLFLSTFNVTAHETIGNLLQNLGSGQWAHPRLRAQIEGVLGGRGGFRDFKIAHDFESIGQKTMRVSGSLIEGVGARSSVLLLSIEEWSGPPEEESEDNASG